METEAQYSLFDDPAFKVLDRLNDAVIETARLYVEQEKQKDGRWTEQQRRQHALQGIDEVLEWRPLTAFKAVQLEFLELLISYWRECEVEAGAPEPDPLQQQ
jgi:hypothetical protein